MDAEGGRNSFPSQQDFSSPTPQARIQLHSNKITRNSVAGSDFLAACLTVQPGWAPHQSMESRFVSEFVGICSQPLRIQPSGRQVTGSARDVLVKKRQHVLGEIKGPAHRAFFRLIGSMQE